MIRYLLLDYRVVPIFRAVIRHKFYTKLFSHDIYSQEKHFDLHKHVPSEQKSLTLRALQGSGGTRRHLATSAKDEFKTMLYRHPEQCERKECLDPNGETCKDHLLGFYLKERGCAVAADGGEQRCTGRI